MQPDPSPIPDLQTLGYSLFSPDRSTHRHAIRFFYNVASKQSLVPDPPLAQAALSVQPSLLVPSGAGRMLSALLRAGLMVEGLESSPGLLEICRKNMDAEGLQTPLHLQPLTELDLARRYQSILVRSGVLSGFLDSRQAVRALARLRAHLAPGGRLALVVDWPSYNYTDGYEPGSLPGPWDLYNQDVCSPEGDMLRVYTRLVSIDPWDQVITEDRRYEFYRHQEMVKEEVHTVQERWFFKNEVVLMLELAGFSEVHVLQDGSDASPDLFTPPVVMAFLARK